MSDYQRITIRELAEVTGDAIYNRLAELEDKIEAGTLVDCDEYIDRLMAAKDISGMTDKELEFFVKHNAKVRENAEVEIARLTAENQRLREEAAEQKSIAEHEHAMQMEWFDVACDYKAENAALQKRLDNTVELPRVECIKTWEWLNRERLGDIMLEWCVLYKKGGWLVVEPCLSKKAAEAWLEEIKESNSDGEGEDMSSKDWFTS